MSKSAKMFFFEETVLRFGKYKGKTLEQVWQMNPGYIDWCISNVDWFFMEKETFESLRKINPRYRFSESSLRLIRPSLDTEDFIDEEPQDYEEDAKVLLMDAYEYDGAVEKFEEWLDNNGY